MYTRRHAQEYVKLYLWFIIKKKKTLEKTEELIYRRLGEFLVYLYVGILKTRPKWADQSNNVHRILMVQNLVKNFFVKLMTKIMYSLLKHTN